MVGTKPFGFLSRYALSLLPPNFPPQSTRLNSKSSSPQHQSTFCTFEESVRPQILSINTSAISILKDQFLITILATATTEFTDEYRSATGGNGFYCHCRLERPTILCRATSTVWIVYLLKKGVYFW